jgi:anti-sigma factor ChrR (cupin superfamily)
MKLAFIASALVLSAPLAYGQTVLQKPDGIKWEPMPEMLVQADGAQFVLISGDMKTGPWVIRFKFLAGYVVQPHTHDEIESVTVLSGTVNMGMGEGF